MVHVPTSPASVAPSATIVMDDIYRAMLDALQRNARLGHTELGRQLGLSATAVADRMRKLEEAGVITGYHTAVASLKMGYSMVAFVRLRTTRNHFPAVEKLALETPAIAECHVVTGDDSFLMRVHAASVNGLDQVLLALAQYGPTTSSIVLKTPVEHKPLPVAHHDNA